MNLGDLYVESGHSMSIVFDQGTEELLLIVRRFIFSVGTNLLLYTKTVKESVNLFFFWYFCYNEKMAKLFVFNHNYIISGLVNFLCVIYLWQNAY